ncbi:PD-(D/E)XK nuclease-like domain-containing protein [Methylobacterium sp. NMS14P]|uniref:PD-(D/E)XK nuclease family protein n=1 Tax=Methylobacterium sp. NMS14P TaxID=2894310 RepID=UPI0023585158|nr:PD-(D/E)XK nuclease family protein [Methylobacterium sp. NMS14P]WCS27826.1 PD-(D/E)XK nuclease-like domain-containing protein [Methylobacterium sp. NMS14P]
MKIVPHLAGFVPGPGLYRMPADTYHADCAPEPSLSSSIAKVLLEQSPEHAALAHPRLRAEKPDEREATRPQEIGTVAHKLILGQGAEVVAIDFDDYKKADAKAARAAAYAAGRAPILMPDLVTAERIADRVLARLPQIPGCEGFTSAPAEVVAVVQDRSGAWLRTMMDRVELHPTHAIIWDVKTSSQAAAPQGLGRRLEQMSMEVQAALYVRVLATLLPHLAGRIRFRWIFVESEEPNGLCVAEADGVAMEVGARKVAAALHLWNRCRAADDWPGYPAEIVRADYPDWAERRWSERESLDPRLAGVSYDVAQSPFRPLNMGSAA